MRVLAFGTYDVRPHPRVAVLMEGLRALGDEVREANAPLDLDTATRVAVLRQPWRLPRFLLRVARCWLVLTIRARQARRDRPDVVLVGYLGHFDIALARCLFRGVPIVLDHLLFAVDTARDRRVTSGWKTRLLARLDRFALRRADLVVVDTPANAALVPPEFASRAVAVPVGAMNVWFEAQRRRSGQHASEWSHRGAGRRPLRVVFFGLFTPLQGTTVLAEALGSLADDPDVEVLVMGHGQDLPRARELAAPNPQVTWRRWVPAAELPSVVADHDVCLGIFGTTPKALRVVPNKVYQGAAASCAVVTSDTRPQRAALGDAAYYVPPGDPVALAEALRTLAADRDRVAKLQTAAHDRAMAAFCPAAVVGGGLRERMLALVERGDRR